MTDRLPHAPTFKLDTYMVADPRPPRYRRRGRSCTTEDGEAKVRYITRSRAKQALHEMYGQSYRRLGIEPYRCQTCRHWHIGHHSRKAWKYA